MSDQTADESESLEDDRTDLVWSGDYERGHAEGRAVERPCPAQGSPNVLLQDDKSQTRREPNHHKEDHDHDKEKDKEVRKNGKKKKTDERKEAIQDERETMAVVTHDHSTRAEGNGTKSENGKHKETKEGNESDELHPPSPWPGRVHGHDSHKEEGKHKRKKEKEREKEREREKEGAQLKSDGAPQELITLSLSPPSGVTAKRRKEERRREGRHECKASTCGQQARSASSELPRGRAFWHKERTPRRGILVRSLSAEDLQRKTSSHEIECKKKRRKKQSKRKALQDEGVKFDKVVVRHYPREVCIGGCMLHPDHGPFLGIGWDWTQEEVHNLYSFERLREPARKHMMHAIPSEDRYAILRHYGLNEDEIRGLVLEMRHKDRELRKGSGSSILPSFWPWKKAA